MVDDIQFIAGKDSTQEEFFHTFNALVDQGKQIVLTADRSPGRDLLARERVTRGSSRASWCRCSPPTTSCAWACSRPSSRWRWRPTRGLQIAEGVLEFLAARITSNLRVLEGALTRLCAQEISWGREITLDLARDILGGRAAPLRPQGLDRGDPAQGGRALPYRLADLIGPKRLRSFARPRQVAMYLAKTMTTPVAARYRPPLRRARPHHDHPWGEADRGNARGRFAQIADDLRCCAARWSLRRTSP
jgi:chromosomal replication initiator protein